MKLMHAIMLSIFGQFSCHFFIIISFFLNQNYRLFFTSQVTILVFFNSFTHSCRYCLSSTRLFTVHTVTVKVQSIKTNLISFYVM